MGIGGKEIFGVGRESEGGEGSWERGIVEWERCFEMGWEGIR